MSAASGDELAVQSSRPPAGPAIWLARAAVGAVFAANLSAAVPFLLRPDRYAPAFELSGVAGEAAVRGIGLLFLMWNVTYPPVILHPGQRRILFLIVLLQQAVGVIGETWIWLGLPAGHAALRRTGLRFMLFDGLGLLAMLAAYLISRPSAPGHAGRLPVLSALGSRPRRPPA